MQKFSFVLSLIIIIVSSACSKRVGCTDPLALNYASDAEVDDENCTYTTDLFAGIYARKDTNIKTIAGFPDSTFTSIKEDTVIFYRADNSLLYLRNFSTCSNDTLIVKATEDSLLLNKTYNCGGIWTKFGAIRNNRTVRYSYTIGEGSTEQQQVRGTAIMQ